MVKDAGMCVITTHRTSPGSCPRLRNCAPTSSSGAIGTAAQPLMSAMLLEFFVELSEHADVLSEPD
jgi:hypothetical protein